LQPDQWNYVIVNLGSLSMLTVARIDVAFGDPRASGRYGGYIDDIGSSRGDPIASQLSSIFSENIYVCCLRFHEAEPTH
jgi:hypothetical protein